MQIRSEKRNQLKLRHQRSALDVFQQQNVCQHLSPSSASTQEKRPLVIAPHPKNRNPQPHSINLVLLPDTQSTYPSIHCSFQSSANSMDPTSFIHSDSAATERCPARLTPPGRASAHHRAANQTVPPFEPPSPSTWPFPARLLPPIAATEPGKPSRAVHEPAAAATAAAAADPFHCDWPFW